MPSDKLLGTDFKVSTIASNFHNICCWVSLVSCMCRLKLGWMSTNTSSMSSVLLRLALRLLELPLVLGFALEDDPLPPLLRPKLLPYAPRILVSSRDVLITRIAYL